VLQLSHPNFHKKKLWSHY